MITRFSILLLTWVALIASSCNEVSFPTAQPAGVDPLQEVPVELQGVYLAKEENGEKPDTLIIESWGYHFKNTNDKDWLGRGVISDSLVLKFYQNYYFVNFKSDDQWVLRLIKRQANGAIDFLSIDIQSDDKEKDVIKRLSRKLKVKKIKSDDDTFYQINPTRDQLMSLIKEGYFTGVTLQRKN